MTHPLAVVLADFRELIGLIDEAAILALRTQTEAQDAHSAYREAGTGSRRPDIRKAQADARTAAEKAGKTARLLAEAANAFAEYVNIIAPGTVAARHSAPDATPSGDRLVGEAPDRGRRIDMFIRKASGKADDLQDGTTELAKSAADAARAAAQAIRGDHGPHGTMTSTPADSEPPQGPSTGVPDNELAAALVVSALAGAVAARAISRYVSRRTDRERGDDEQK
jgi:hypothetical protein